MRATAGIDIGGTTTDAVVVAGDGQVLARVTLPTVPGDASAVAATATDALRLAFGNAGTDEISALGVGIPGLVDCAAGSTRHAINLGIGDEPLPIGPLLAGGFGVPVAVDNDARTAALGVYADAVAAHTGLEDMAYVSIGTGISAGLVLGGALYRGRGGAAGEIGHIVVDAAGRPCKCGQRGCLETVVSGEVLRGVPATAEVVAALATTAVALVLTLDVEQIWLGGGAVHHTPGMVGSLRTALTSAEATSPLLARLAPSSRIFTTDPDRPVGAIGAARLAADRVAGWVTPLETQTTTRKGE